MLSQSAAGEKPRIVILGGQPGAGKTALSEMVVQIIFETSLVTVINGDDYLDIHPRLCDIVRENEKLLAYFTDPDVRLWTKCVFDKAIKNRRDIIFESTLRTPHPIAETISSLKQNGYAVTLAVMATPHAVSRLSMILRYEAQKEIKGFGRWTSPDNHDEAYRGLIETVRFLENNSPLDKLLVFNRSGTMLYRNERGADGIFTAPPTGHDAASAIEINRNNITQEMRDSINALKKYIFDKMRKRGADADEIKETERILDC